jgi:ATP-binding protein involved in chromosome partitioning
MVHGAVRQLLGDVDWGRLDYLVVDLPPGTGDVPLTLAQSVPVTGAVVVSTPQAVALGDAVRAAGMYQSLGVSVLGFVENMSYFVCDRCGAEHDIFGRGDVRRYAEGAGLAFLGELPLSPAMRVNTDSARAEQDFEQPGALREAVESLVANVAEAVRRRRQSGPAPQPLTVRAKPAPPNAERP